MIMGIQDISAFYFVWPWALALLLLIPVGWLLYIRHHRRRLEKTALHFSYVSIVEQIKRQPATWKRLLLPIAVSAMAAGLIIGLARPTVTARVPVNSVDMMIVLDISLSMMADDMKPNRLEAAKDAAIRFVETLPRDVRVGLEVFAGDNFVLSPPSSQHREVAAYLKALRKEDLKPRTEIGSALHTALKTLQPIDDPDTKATNHSTTSQGSAAPAPSPDKKPDRVIVLLSDGDSHEGYPWDQAARDAVRDNVIIHTIGIGSSEGGLIEYQGMELPVTFDEATLRQIADTAGGNYFRVFTETDFRKVYEQIHARTIHYEERDIELAFALAGLNLAVLAGALLLLWFI